jgi:hypothetical protein
MFFRSRLWHVINPFSSFPARLAKLLAKTHVARISSRTSLLTPPLFLSSLPFEVSIGAELGISANDLLISCFQTLGL